MNELTCHQLHELDAEFALGVLPGEQRAAALAHLDHCTGCREHIEQLTMIGDALLELVPAVEPPLGFETRVMNRLNPTPPQRRRWLPLAAAAAAIALVFGLAGWAVGTVTHPTPPPSREDSDHVLLEAAFTADSERVGTIYAYAGRRDWVYMWVRTRPDITTVSCELVRRDGSPVRLGSFRLEDGRGYWAAPTPVDPLTVTGARVVAEDGAVLATARFPRPPR
jgi:hypothetical protein